MEENIKNQGWKISNAIMFLLGYEIISVIIQIPLYIMNLNSFRFYPVVELLIFGFLIKKFYLDKNNEILVNKIPTLMGVISLVFLVFSFKLIYNNTIALVLEKYITFDFIDLMEIYEPLIEQPVQLFLSIVIVAPIVEEVLFREILLNKLLKRYSAMKAIVISSLLFAVVHLSIFSMINALLLGGIFGYIYYRYKSVVLCIFLHSLANMIVLVKILLFKADVTYLEYWNILTSNQYLNVLIGVIFGIFALMIFRNNKVIKTYE